MARILIVDGNPDTHRSLCGLLKYRTAHDFDIVGTCAAGIRKAVSLAPDVIMINALLFMSNNYAFPRVMQKHPETAGISFVVHAVGELGEITKKQIEASGVARAVELPLSAEELDAEIERVMAQMQTSKRASGGVQPVQWKRVSRTDAKTQTPKKVVKPVQWPTASKAPQAAADAPEKPEMGNAFRAFSDVSASKDEAKGFRAAGFRRVGADETGRVKGKSRGEFHEQTWAEVDPGQVKPRTRKRP